MTQKTIITILCIAGSILLIPFFAMQCTAEVQWTTSDFLVAAILLLGFGFLMAFVWNKLGKSNYRMFIIVGILIVLLLLWAELAVGIFDTPLAGS